jgi:hypothetical protein
MSAIVFTGEPLKVLDFDIECRPVTYGGGDFTFGEVTAIASAWVVDGKPKHLEVVQLTQDHRSLRQMLRAFLRRYNEADMVTGHFIRGFDLPVLNGALLRQGLHPLSDKLTHDTKNDLLRRKHISASQESLGATLGLEHPKVVMTQHDWYLANTLQKKGLAKTRKRVAGDVKQHVELREELLKRGWLGRPKVWQSSSVNSGFSTAYVP